VGQLNKVFENHSNLVSIIVPCYNYAHFLSQTLDSVFAQTYQNWECIIIDDGSKDDTRLIANRYLQKDVRFKYIYQDNQGLSSARNTGISNSRGKFLQFLDSDDLIERRKLEVQVSLLTQHEHVDIIYSNMRYFLTEDHTSRIYCMWLKPEEDREWMPKVSGSGNHVLDALLYENIMVVNSPLIRRSLLKDVGVFDEELKSWEDWDYWLRCAIKGKFFYYDDSELTLALVRIHANSMSKSNWAMMYNSYLVRKKMDGLLVNKVQKINNEKYSCESLKGLTKLVINNFESMGKEYTNEKLNILWKTTKHKKFILIKYYNSVFPSFIVKKLISLHFQGIKTTLVHQFEKLIKARV
jgi:glycosyltransferase involved in cell wall biosynthesis